MQQQQKVDLIKTDLIDLKKVLKEYDKDTLINIICRLKIELEKEFESFEMTISKEEFERIRRITG